MKPEPHDIKMDEKAQREYDEQMAQEAVAEWDDKQKRLAKHGVKATRQSQCPHICTTIIDDKRYCVDCGEEVIDWLDTHPPDFGDDPSDFDYPKDWNDKQTGVCTDCSEEGTDRVHFEPRLITFLTPSCKVVGIPGNGELVDMTPDWLEQWEQEQYDTH